MVDGPEGRIFISYRRTDTPHIAGRLFDWLERRFGEGNVFMDVDSIAPGLDFADAINEAVSSCDVLLALIGSGWVDAVDGSGNRRLEDPDDFITLEITTALQRQIRVIPVVVDGAAPPRRHDLPEMLGALARRQAIPLDHATFRTGATALLTAIEQALRAAAAERDSPPAGAALSEADDRTAVLRSEEIGEALVRAWNESNADQDGVLVVQVAGVEGYYFQFLVSAPRADVYAELVGPEYLAPQYRLAEQQERLLERFGWAAAAPPELPNYSRTYGVHPGYERQELRQIGLDVIRTIALAYRVPVGRELSMTFPETDDQT